MWILVWQYTFEIQYQLLMTQSILAFYSQNLWSKELTRPSQRTFHWVLQATGSTAAIIGMIIEFVNRSQRSKDHFSSPHSIVGLTAGICTLIGMLNGVSALWSGELRRYVSPVYLKLAHNLNGITAFVLGKFSIRLVAQTKIKLIMINSDFDSFLWSRRNGCAVFWIW